jgi:hypothetical protein
MPCRVDGCDRHPNRLRGTICETHYCRIRRTGTTDPRPPLPPIQPCSVDGCDTPARARTHGLCGKHREAQRRWGDPTINKAGWARRDDPGYRAAHRRVARSKGPASRHACPCGAPAAHWAYDHQDPDQRIGQAGAEGEGLPYSLDPSHYRPRCVPCHKTEDLARLKQEAA